MGTRDDKGRNEAGYPPPLRSWPDGLASNDSRMKALLFYEWLKSMDTGILSYGNFGDGAVYPHIAVGIEEWEKDTEALAQYHLSCEDKFANGQFVDRGRTERRHVVATGFELIGKEANRVGESGEIDPVRSAVQEFSELAEFSDEKRSKPG
jgi:hypothetical protein